MAKNYYNIPFINISKETLKLINDMLTVEQSGEILQALYPYIYENVEPTFTDKATLAVWNNIVSVMDRKAEGYIKKVNKGKENLAKGREARQEKINKQSVETVQEKKEETTEEYDNIPSEIMKSLRNTPQPIRNMICDKWPENYIELFHMFRDFHEDSEKDNVNDRFFELCRLYDVEESKESKKIVKGVIDEFEDRMSDRQNEIQQPLPWEETDSAPAVETECEVEDSKYTLVENYIKERPYILSQGQSFQCFIMGSPSVYDFMYNNGINEKEFEKVYNKVVKVR